MSIQYPLKPHCIRHMPVHSQPRCVCFRCQTVVCGGIQASENLYRVEAIGLVAANRLVRISNCVHPSIKGPGTATAVVARSRRVNLRTYNQACLHLSPEVE